MQTDRRHQCRGQRLIKQRGTFAPALLTNLSPVKMTVGEAWHSPRPYVKSPFRLLCPINSQNGLSVYHWAFWRDPSKSYGYAIMSRGGRSIFVGLFYHYILNKRFIVSWQGKKNAKVKDTGRVNYTCEWNILLWKEGRLPRVLKLPYVFIQVVQLFQRAAKATSFINPRWDAAQDDVRKVTTRAWLGKGGASITKQVCFIQRYQENSIHFICA